MRSHADPADCEPEMTDDDRYWARADYEYERDRDREMDRKLHVRDHASDPKRWCEWCAEESEGPSDWSVELASSRLCGWCDAAPTSDHADSCPARWR